MLVLTEQCSCLLGPQLCCPPPADHPHLPHRGQLLALAESSQHIAPMLTAPPAAATATQGHGCAAHMHKHVHMYTRGHRDTGTHAMDMSTQTHVHMHTRAHPNTCTWKHRCKLTNVPMHKRAHGSMHTHGHGHMQAHPRAHTLTGTPALAHPVTQQILGLRTCLLPRHCLFCQRGVQPWAQPAL